MILKLTWHLNRDHVTKEMKHLPTIRFQGLTLSFRDGMFLVTKATIHVESISFGEFIIKMFATLVKLVKDPTLVE